MNLTDEYKLSVYAEEKLIKETDLCRVALVRSSVDGKSYIKKEYADNKSDVYTVLQKIDCHNLPKIADIIDGRIVIEEHIDGVTLEQKLDSGKLTERQKRHIEKQLLAALSALHKSGIVHRDVKLSNIIIKPDGAAVLIDFGIAKLYKPQADKDTSLFGTVGYAPPEQFGFAPTDYRSDVYSFGVTAQKLGGKSYKKIIARCKEFDPNRRYANAAEIILSVKKQTAVRIAVAVVSVVFIATACVGIKELTETPLDIGEESTSAITVTEQQATTNADIVTEQQTTKIVESTEGSPADETQTQKETTAATDDAAQQLLKDYNDANSRLYIYDYIIESSIISYPSADEVRIDAKVTHSGILSDLVLITDRKRNEFTARFSRDEISDKAFRLIIGTFIPEYDDYAAHATQEDIEVKEQFYSDWEISGNDRVKTLNVRGYEIKLTVFNYNPDKIYTDFVCEVQGSKISR